VWCEHQSEKNSSCFNKYKNHLKKHFVFSFQRSKINFSNSSRVIYKWKKILDCEVFKRVSSNLVKFFFTFRWFLFRLVPVFSLWRDIPWCFWSSWSIIERKMVSLVLFVGFHFFVIIIPEIFDYIINIYINIWENYLKMF
jgi:hypothetical protein